MAITIQVKLSHLKDSDYIIDIDVDPLRSSGTETPQGIPSKTALGAIKRPTAERLKMLKHPELAEEEKATEAVMDSLEL